jgi:uncharacterized membrane protein YgdD (TMEM256/DUF423 family)
MLYRPALLLGTLCAALSVILGAFGAHALKETLTPELLQTFETGVRYQFYHAVALLFAGLLHAYLPRRVVRTATLLFAVGILLFSGSIYALVALKSGGSVGLGPVGMLTPIGGVLWIAGWLCLAWACTQIPKKTV